MTQHDPNAFDQALVPDLHVPATRLLAICRQLLPAYRCRHTIPVLGTVRIDASANGTTFRVTDLDIDITVTADDLDTADPFAACVPFALLHRIAGSLDGIIRISYRQSADKHGFGQLSLATDDGCSATVNLLCPAEDFPARAEIAESEWQVIDTGPADLRRMIDLARPCISTMETRYYLNGINFQCRPGHTTLRSVATDGHRMAVIDGAIEAPEGLNIIMPTVCVDAIRALINPKANDPVALRIFKQTRIRLTCGAIQIDCKLIDGTFPDYTRVIPEAETQVSVTLTAAALRRLAPFATQRFNAVVLSAGRASLKNPDMEGEISTPVTMTIADEDGKGALATGWGFNLTYLAAQARLTPTFRMEMASPSDPARVFGEDPEAMWIVMPRRV